MNKMNKRSCHSHGSKYITCITKCAQQPTSKFIEYKDLLKIQISTNNIILKRIDEIQIKIDEIQLKLNEKNTENITPSKERIKFINPIVDLIETPKKEPFIFFP